MRRLWICTVLCLASCSVDRPHAILNDIGVRPEFESGYRVVAVDGKPVERAHGKGGNSVASYVPFAWVEPGTHSLTLKMDNDFIDKNPQLPEEVTISAKLEAEKRYRIACKDGAVSLVQDFER